MILATDVHYPENGGAIAAGILFADWSSKFVQDEIVVRIDQVEPYVPGQFFKRELPCLVALIRELSVLPTLILVDGYVTLGSQENYGLGMHLFHALGKKVPVVGVAKNRFRDTPEETVVLRGTSRRPLYVTSVGIDPSDARAGVQAMEGCHRMPDILGKVDLLCRQEVGNV